MSNKKLLIEFMDWLQECHHINKSEEDRKVICEEFIKCHEEQLKANEADYWKRYKAEHPEQYRAYREKWEKNNLEKRKESRKQYREKNLEKIKDYQKAYRERKKQEDEQR